MAKLRLVQGTIFLPRAAGIGITFYAKISKRNPDSPQVIPGSSLLDTAEETMKRKICSIHGEKVNTVCTFCGHWFFESVDQGFSVCISCEEKIDQSAMEYLIDDSKGCPDCLAYGLCIASHCTICLTLGEVLEYIQHNGLTTNAVANSLITDTQACEKMNIPCEREPDYQHLRESIFKRCNCTACIEPVRPVVRRRSWEKKKRPNNTGDYRHKCISFNSKNPL